MLEQHLPHLGEKFRVWIEDAPTRTRLPEHDPHTSKDKVCCYIKSSVNQRFRVCVEWEGDKWCAQGSECWACYIYLDGQCIRAGLLGRWDGYTRREICVDEIDGGPGEAMSLHFGKTQTSGKTLFLDGRLRGGDSGIEDREMCEELGSIRVELRRARPLRPVPDGYHPHVNRNLTYNVNNINVLKIHSAKLSLLRVVVLTVDMFLNPRKRLGSTGIVSFPSRNTIHLSFSNTEVKVLSKSNMRESDGF
jgi:hypothetical protein